MGEQPYRFGGFHRPRYTVVPDDLFDELLPELTEAELKVLLYIVRRTFGFKKDSDTISLRQLVEGIRTRDGVILDRGTGVSKSTASRAVQGLVAKGIVVATKNSTAEKGDQPTTYQLRFADDPRVLSQNTGDTYDRTGSLPTIEHPRVLLQNPQETVNQETVNNKRDTDWRRTLADTMTPQNFRRWIEPLQLIELANSHAVMRAPDTTIADYVQKRLSQRVAEALGVERLEITVEAP